MSIVKKDRNNSSDRSDRQDRSEGRGGFKFKRSRRKVCNFCVDKEATINYKEDNKLKKYISERGKILARRATGTCAKHQREVTIAIKRARHICLLPYKAD